ncbi:MAG: hypothetical protein QOI95_2809 [Acidimicrobiaceae bacterium]
MLNPGRARAVTRFALAGLVFVALAGCGTPSGLDHQEQVAFARECTSLIERNLSDNTPPRAALLAGEDLNLDNPSGFYSIVERLRGPSTYNLHDSTRSTDTARQPLDDCNTKPRVLSSLFGSRSGTTTTTTATTVPGS